MARRDTLDLIAATSQLLKARRRSGGARIWIAHNPQTIRNMIDRGEMGHVRVGQRRVQVRQSQLDAFLAAGDSSAQLAEANPWQAVGEASSAVVAAVKAQDRDALDRAISTLADAARDIPS